MARDREVRKKGNGRAGRVGGRVCATGLLALLMLVSFVSVALAVPSAPTIGQTEWRTGEIETAWSGVTAGNTIILYVASHQSAGVYQATDTWTASSGSGSHITQYFENGQTVWHYIVQVDSVTGEISSPSNIGKQTPPITAYIINWPEMFSDFQSLFNGLEDVIRAANQELIQEMRNLSTPSESARANMQDAVNGAKSALGVGQAEAAGSALKSSLDGAASNAKPTIYQNDGVGTYTGGRNPEVLPPLEGTMNEASFCVPITKKPDGSYLRACLFTDEQMEKLKWMKVFYSVLEVIPWIMFAVYVVQRFTPSFKV